MEANRKRLGRFLRKRRKELTLSQEAVAHLLGWSQAYVSQWERGLVLRHTPEELAMWSNVLQITLADLSEVAGYGSGYGSDPNMETLRGALPYLTEPRAANFLVAFAQFLQHWSAAESEALFGRDRARLVENTDGEASAGHDAQKRDPASGMA